MTTASSPASTGPAGSLFEAQAGAHYLLSLLIGLEPRGLPGTRIEHVKFQRAAEGHPLDDIVVHACAVDGSSAVLEIQAKRGLSFTTSSQEFRDVVAQIARASQRPGFFDRRHELAVAVGRAPRNVQGPYQDVLTWAQQVGSADTFAARIERPGSANHDMRRFVDAFKAHLAEAGAAHDGETVWLLLSRFQILHFDFTAQGSAHEAWQLERAAHALHSDEAGRAEGLWRNLVALAIEAAASGGQFNRDELVQRVRDGGFRLAGERRYSSVRRALTEDSRHALEDISDRVGKVRLMRGERLAAVRTALDQGRYVELRGDPGVGKSGLLKRLAEEISRQSRIIVLSPDRVTPGGWAAMRAALGFDGTARELLVDLAASGGSALFIDGLEAFSQTERHTVVDLVRAAADIPGFSVVVTARTGYGGENEEAEWLPTDTLERLGYAPPVIVGELDTDEVDELRDAAPELVPLLADAHPAKDIARNLFRLERLARQLHAERKFRTEVDMAEDWWRTADGKEEGRRDRARLLRALARQALASETLNAEAHRALAIDALVKSRTLRDLVGEKVAFRHDILRDWAVANLLFEEPGITGCLPLNRPVPTRMVRGLELAARMQLERGTDDGDWRSLMGKVSQDGAHGSWRRAVLLAVVRSEIGTDLLDRTADLLLANDAHLLIELIRTVRAVESRPLSEHLVRIAAPVPEAPTDLYVPSDPSWNRLVLWLLVLEDRLPEAAIADAATFLTASYTGVLSQDGIGPVVARWFYRRLEGIEAHRSDPLASELRLGFLTVCHCAPSHTACYLGSLMQCHWRDEAIQTVMGLSSVVAQAAPQELAELTIAILMPSRQGTQSEFLGGLPESLSDLPSSGSDDFRREPFGSNDLAFVPPSPQQGPFFDLLVHAPAIGLKLVRQLVDHATSIRSRGEAPGADTVVIPFPDGERAFSWLRTYTWSREWANGDSCVQSAMMALEAWAHRRIDGGKEEVEAVLADVLPPAGGPAAFLLVAVDLVLSHWPKSNNVATPFLGCPDLLCLDLQRAAADAMPIPDIWGLGALAKTTDDTSGSRSLEARPSRQCSLYSLLGNYAISGPPDIRTEIERQLLEAVERLGPYGKDAGRLHPEFMAVHALNILNPENWQETTVVGPNGESIGVKGYLAPPEEDEHLERLRGSVSPSLADRGMQSTVRAALLDPSRSSPEFAAKAVGWANGPTPPPVDDAWDKNNYRNLAIIAAGVVAMRDGDEEFRARHRMWARSVFLKALTNETDVIVVPETNVQFNSIAMAFIGIVYLLRGAVEREDVRVLLEGVSRRDLLTASGLRVSAELLASVDERLPRALLRIALASCICPRRRRGISGDVETLGVGHRTKSAIEGELSWLFGDDNEPEWPVFPKVLPIRNFGFKIAPNLGELSAVVDRTEVLPQPDEYVDEGSAALWLRSVSSLFDVQARPWLLDVARSYVEWTAAVNGSQLEAWDRIKKAPWEWNAAYYDLVARCLPGLEAESIDHLALDPIRSLPDQSFFGLVAQFLRSVDEVYFSMDGFRESEAVRVRTALAERLSGSPDWKWAARDPSASIEVNLGTAIAALFFNRWNRLSLSACYLQPLDIIRVEPFLPVLERLAVEGPGGFVAHLLLDLVEVSPKPEHLSFIVAAAEGWLAAHPHDTGFWIDIGTAGRLCAVIDSVRSQEPFTRWDSVLRDRVSSILSGLVGIGVPEAAQLEQNLAAAGED